jgi:hypothetical protein
VLGRNIRKNLRECRSACSLREGRLAKLTVGTTAWKAGTYELTVSYAGTDLGRRLVAVDGDHRFREGRADLMRPERSISGIPGSVGVFQLWWKQRRGRPWP